MDEPDIRARRAERRRRVVQAVKLPLFSGKASALVLIGCFLVPALLVPLVLRWPWWIDAALVVGCWWLTWVVALTIVLYRGHKVTDDHAMKQPRSWGLGDKLKDWSPAVDLSDGIDFSADSGGACLVALLIVLALPLLVLLIWFLAEVGLPLLAFIAYVLVRGQLAHVANDKHGCEGSLVKAPLWGTLWATVYTTPLAVLVWFVHFVTTKPA